jgi:hypothetical protein
MYGFTGNAALGGVWVSNYTTPHFTANVYEHNVRAGVRTAFPAGTSMTVWIGRTASSLTPYTAASFEFAGATDIAILHLSTQVPATVAVPVTVATAAPSLTAPFTLAGWGDTTGNFVYPSQRQIGTTTSDAVIPEVWESYRQYHRFVLPVTTGEVYGLPGDSGGPAFQTINGVRTLVGVFNEGGGGAGIYQAVWVGSTDDSFGYAHPNTAAWIRAATR